MCHQVSAKNKRTLYAIEDEVRGKPADFRLSIRQTRTRPLVGLTQFTALICPPPLEDLVRVHPMRTRDFSDAGAGFQCQLNDPSLL